MVKNLITASKFIFKRIVSLLIIAGLAYLIYPWTVSLAPSWQEPLDSSAIPILAESPPPVPPTGGNGVKLTSVPLVRPHPNPLPEGEGVKSPSLWEGLGEGLFLNLMPLSTGGEASQVSPRIAVQEATPTETATSTPRLPTATSTPSPPPTAISPVIITETPTPLNIITVAAEAARATSVATAIGTYTPIPFNWILPIVITLEPATPVPLNSATATFQVVAATAFTFVNGTPTPTPINLWTATATPFMRPVVGEVATPWIPPTPTPTPLPIPEGLVGKIVFLSNRSGGPTPLPDPHVYAVNPDGSNLSVLNNDTFYKTALTREAYSPDQQYLALVTNVRNWFSPPSDLTRSKQSSPVEKYELVQAIFFHDYQYNVTQQLTSFGIGDAYAPAWSPTQAKIALVSTESQFAEIWTINLDGSDVRQLTITDPAVLASQVGKNTYIPDEANGHPSWSPDGSQIVFWSSRNGHREIYVMDADGGNVRRLSTTRYDDWDPVWVKHTDPARYPTPILPTDGNF